MKIVSTEDAQATSVSRLGFDSEYVDLSAPEVIAALIRRTAAFLCPCTSQALQKAVTTLLTPLNSLQNLPENIGDAIDSVIEYGDLIEAETKESINGGPLLYLAPPSFVEVSPQLFLVFGIVPDGEDTVPLELRNGVSPVLWARRLRVTDSTEATDALLQAGYIRLKLDNWLKCPSAVSPAVLKSQYDQALTLSGAAGTPEDVMILDLARSARFYKGRWTPLKNQSGRFVARRSKSYGAQLWCYIEAENGEVTRLLDLPYLEKQWNAFDEARHLLQALDAGAGQPQIYRVQKDNRTHTARMDLFSPVPSWATRKWDAVGARVISKGALFSYVFLDSDVDAECRFAQERMWLKQE